MRSRKFLSGLIGGRTTAVERKRRFIPHLERLEERETPSAYAGTFAISVEGVGGPRVQVYQVGLAGGFNLVADFYAYTQQYTGGVSVAVGDIDGDGINDIVTCSRFGTAHVQVFRGIDNDGDFVLDAVDTTNPIASFYAADLPGGNVTVGNFDTTNDGTDGVIRNEIAVGASLGSSRVMVFRNNVAGGVNGSQVSADLFSDNPTVAASFFAFASSPAGGVNLATGNLDNSIATAQIAADELIVGTGTGAQGVVNVYNFNAPGIDTASALNVQPSNVNYEDRVVAQFLPFGNGYVGGVNVAVGNVITNSADTNIASEIIVGMQQGAALVNVFQTVNNETGLFNGINTDAFHSFPVFNTPPGYTGGVNVGFNNVGGGAASVLVAPGQSKVPTITAIPRSLEQIIQRAQLPGVYGSFAYSGTSNQFVPSSFGGLFDTTYLGGLTLSE
jgi:hypothetical protein